MNSISTNQYSLQQVSQNTKNYFKMIRPRLHNKHLRLLDNMLPKHLTVYQNEKPIKQNLKHPTLKLKRRITHAEKLQDADDKRNKESDLKKMREGVKFLGIEWDKKPPKIRKIVPQKIDVESPLDGELVDIRQLELEMNEKNELIRQAELAILEKRSNPNIDLGNKF